MKKIILLITSLILLSSCEVQETSYSNENGVEDVYDASVVVKNTDLYGEEERDNVKFITFETNDEKFLKKEGFTIWTTKKINETDVFEDFEVGMTKLSGTNTTGYGIVFCNQMLNDKLFMYVVMINNIQQYIIGKVVDGNFSAITNWTTDSNLNRGTGVNNLIRIEFDEQDRKFKVNLNNAIVKSFTVETNLSFKNSKRGYVTVISPKENFPKESVKVLFFE